VTQRLPASARRVFEQGLFCYLAVGVPEGLHVTPVVFVYSGGRIWVTTARASVKARSWRLNPAVAGLVRSADLAVAFRGSVRTYAALDPLSWPGAAAAGPRLALAATRFSLKNARFFAGYAMDAMRIPLAWTPPARLFAGIELTAGRVLNLQAGTVREGWGAWPAGASFRKAVAPLPRKRGIDLKVPAAVRKSIGRSGLGALALDGAHGPVVLPAQWRRVAAAGSFESALPVAFAGLSGAPESPQAALAADHASAWRATEMAGMILQGTADLFAPWGGKEALVRLRPDRVVWWSGWSSGSVS
jgi:Pyridoxamine 5'-phosphate oxidase